MSEGKSIKPTGIVVVFAILHVLGLVAIGYIFWAKMQPCVLSSDDWDFTVHACIQVGVSADSIEVAAQMGRLDLVTIALALLGVALTVAAIGGFFTIRSAAIQAAREEAKIRTNDALPSLLTPQLLATVLQDNPQILIGALSYAQRVFESVPEEDADEIALADHES